MNIKDLPLTDTYGFHVFTGSDCAKFEPRLATDEFWSNEGRCWRECGDAGQNFYTIFIYRRRIDPGPGWEIVPLDGELEHLNEYTDDGKKWVQIRTHSPLSIGDYINRFAYRDKPILAVRRKSAPKVESVGGWISVKDRLPELGQDVWVFLRGEVIQWQNTNSRYWDKDAITHWQPFIKPAPPKPEPSADEVAFEKWWIKSSGKKDWISSKCDCLDSWQAALAYARKGQPQ